MIGPDPAGSAVWACAAVAASTPAAKTANDRNLEIMGILKGSLRTRPPSFTRTRPKSYALPPSATNFPRRDAGGGLRMDGPNLRR